MLLNYNFQTILLLHGAITDQNLKVIAYSQSALWFFKVANLDVCGSLVLSNPVTYFDLYIAFILAVRGLAIIIIIIIIIIPRQEVTTI